MTELMKLLYDHTLDTGFTSGLCRWEYREAEQLAERLSAKLRQSLSDGAADTLTAYQDALAEQQDMELEAMFVAAFSLGRAL